MDITARSDGRVAGTNSVVHPGGEKRNPTERATSPVRATFNSALAGDPIALSPAPT
jgi:hypothetical protein